MTLRLQSACAECETRAQEALVAAVHARPRTPYRAVQCVLVAKASFFSGLLEFGKRAPEPPASPVAEDAQPSVVGVAATLAFPPVDDDLHAFDPFEALFELFVVLIGEVSRYHVVDHRPPRHGRLVLGAVVSNLSGAVPIILRRRGPAKMRVCYPPASVDAPGPIKMPDRPPLAGYLAIGLVCLLLVAGTTAFLLLRDAPPPVPTSGPVTVPPDSAATVEVPDVTGLDQQSARQALETAGLHLGELREDHASGPQGAGVTRQVPAAGTLLTKGAPVDVWLAAADSAIVPDLGGLTQEEGVAAAQAAGLTLELLAEVTDEVLPGRIFRQSPRAGERVTPGSRLVAVLNAASPTTGGEQSNPGTPVAAFFTALAHSYSFPVLYPAILPSGLVPDPASDNPHQVTGPGGEQGFEVRYLDPARPNVRVSILEGDWFEMGDEGDTTVDVRGYPAFLTRLPGGLMVGWQEGAVRYAVSTEGLSDDETAALADGLEPLPGP